MRKLCKEAWRLFKKLTSLGYPKRFPIVQFPNLPLIIALIAGTVSRHTHGTSHGYWLAVAFLGMTIWAYEELISGVSWFRHLLGATYLIILVMRVAHAIH